MKVRAEKLVPVETLREWLSYDAATGVITWRKGRQSICVGGRAGYVASTGHRVLKIEKKRHFAHRVAWAMQHGDWPPDDYDVDHINGDRDDNSATNLRLATRAENLRNAKRSSRNTSGVKGVCWNSRERKWMAQIRHSGKRFNLGCFRDIDAAAEAYRIAALRYHGKFANFGD